MNWLPPLYELRNGEIKGYNIGYKVTSVQSNSYNFSSSSGDGEDGTGEMILTGLSKYTRYTIIAQGFNQVGPGPLSEPVSAQTMEDGECRLKSPFSARKNKFRHISKLMRR